MHRVNFFLSAASFSRYYPTLITHSLLWSATAAGINPVRARQRDFFRIIPRNRRNSVPSALIPYKPSRLVAKYFSREPRNARDGRWKIWKCDNRMRSWDGRLNERARVRVDMKEKYWIDRRILYYTHGFWNCMNIFIWVWIYYFFIHTYLVFFQLLDTRLCNVL